MKKLVISLILLLSATVQAQISMNPLTTVPCTVEFSFVNFTVTPGSSPYSFTVQSPACASSYTSNSTLTNGFFTVTCQGIYTLTVRDASNTLMGPVTHSVNLSTHMDAGISTSGGDDTLCITGIMELYPGNYPGFVVNPITWNTSETAPYISVSPTVTTTYSYSALYTSAIFSRTCTAEGHETLVVIDCGFYAGVEDVGISSFLNIYPNPVGDHLTVDFTSGMASIDKVSLFNTLGETIREIVRPLNKQDIDLQGVKPGLYYLKAQNGQVELVFKVLKQ